MLTMYPGAAPNVNLNLKFPDLLREGPLRGEKTVLKRKKKTSNVPIVYFCPEWPCFVLFVPKMFFSSYIVSLILTFE